MKHNILKFKKIFLYPVFIFGLVSSFAIPIFAQDDDLMKELNKSQSTAKEEPIIGTFNSTRIINVHTNETVGKNVLEFRITHRFGAIEGGGHGLWGLDASSDIHIGFDYGITSDLMVGIGRSKINERYDGFVKYRLLKQTESKVPLSITLLANTTIDASKRAKFDVGPNEYDNYPNFSSRVNYLAQVIIARKFGKRFSALLSPTFLHRNYVGSYSYDYYIKEDQSNRDNPFSAQLNSNNVFAVGAGVKFRVSPLLSITADAAYPFSTYLYNKPSTTTPYFVPIGIGVELEVGGHIFSINATNSEAILPNQYLISSSTGFESWGSRLGFTIVRVFTPGKRIVKKNAEEKQSKPKGKVRERE